MRTIVDAITDSIPISREIEQGQPLSNSRRDTSNNNRYKGVIIISKKYLNVGGKI